MLIIEVRLPRLVFPLVLVFVLFVHCEAPALEITTQQLPLFITGRLSFTNNKFSSTQTYLIQGYLLKGRGEVDLVCRLALEETVPPRPDRVNKPGLGSIGI